MIARTTCLGLIVTMLAVAPAPAQTSNAPCPALKTKLRMTDGNTIEAVADLGGGVCRFKSQKDGKYFERILGAFLASDPNFERARGLVPLEVGKKIEFQTSGADDKGQPTSWIKMLAVEKYEKTTSPAGTFDAFVILSQTRLFQGGGTWEQRYWYAPAVGYVVNSKYTMVQGTPPRRVPSDWYVVEVIK